MFKKHPERKRLAKIFLAYALVSTALFGTGYGLQKGYDKAFPQEQVRVVQHRDAR
jgi:hypothetical protein